MTPIERLLLGYCVLGTTLVGGWTLWGVARPPERLSVIELDAQRLNIREPDGRLRLVATSAARTPGILFRGKEYPHPSRRSAGLLFFNDQGTENGGLIFDGARRDGRVTSSGHLSFDQFEQDQVVTLDQSENDGRRWAGLGVADRPVQPLDVATLSRAATTHDPTEQTRLMDSLKAQSGHQRVFVGKQDEASRVILKDAQGRDRLRLEVTAPGKASITFLDETGRAVRTYGPQPLARQF